jgi:hypothetical protein
MPGKEVAMSYCKGRGAAMTWSRQRREYGRLARKGRQPEASRQLFPRCQKRVSQRFRTTTTTPPPQRAEHEDAQTGTG